MAHAPTVTTTKVTAKELVAAWEERYLSAWEQRGRASTARGYARVVAENRTEIRKTISRGRGPKFSANADADREARAQIRAEVDALVAEANAAP